MKSLFAKMSKYPMKKLGLVLLALMGFIGRVYSQELEEFVFLDNGETDSLIRRYAPKPLPSSYYVLMADVGVSETTLLPQTRQRYQEIVKMLKCNETIVFVISNNAFPSRFLPEYFETSFEISKKQQEQYVIIESEELFRKLLNGTWLEKHMYIFRHKLCYREVSKNNRVTNRLPHERFVIKPAEKVVISPDKLLFKAGTDGIFPFKPGYVVIAPDLRPELLCVNISTGVIENRLLVDTLDPYTILQNLNQKRKNKLGLPSNRSLSDFYKKIGRHTLSLPFVYYEAPYLYCVVDMEVPIKNKQTQIVKNEDNEYYERPKGGYELTPFTAFLVLDEKLRIKEWIMPDENFPLDSLYLGANGGFLVEKQQTIYANAFIEVTENDTVQYTFPTKEYAFNIKKQNYELGKTIYAYTKEENDLAFRYGGFIFYVRFQDSIFFASSPLDGWRSANSLKKYNFNPWCHFIPRKDVIFDEDIYIEDTIDKHFYNYNILAANTVLGGKYLATLYNFQMNRLLLELRDANMKILDVIDLHNIDPQTFMRPFNPYFESLSVTIHDDSIILLTLENDQIVLKKYKIEELTCK